MGRTLRMLGLTLLAGAVWMYLAEAMRWIQVGPGSEWGGLLLKAGLVALAAGVVLAAWAPVGREIRRGRCVRCGAPIERSQTYCMDHLREAVNQFRDQSRERTVGRAGSGV